MKPPPQVDMVSVPLASGLAASALHAADPTAPAAAGTAPPQPGSVGGPVADPDGPATLSSPSGSWASWLPSLWGGPAAGPTATNDPSSPSFLPSGSGGVSKYKLYVKKPKTVVGQKEDVKEAVEAAAEQTRRPVPTFPLLPIRVIQQHITFKHSTSIF